ncbi:XdhC family protein [Paenibacillus nuruki]|uniref:XdhC family protein n=1 Tax=Paenibacillus nuruki TaxID=1886670 RepID=UPI0028039AC0|nr:XdhC family protein [Paenibacillus nuruki]CAJ1315642.1 Xanthine dehydrogenase [Paenibacillus nuruki]
MDMKDLCTIALSQHQQHIRTVLATVVHVEGHAYRKEGVSMILTADGQQFGSISPGCLESDLVARVDAVWNSLQVCVVEYDMRPADDLSWGENIGCGGLLNILLEPVRGSFLNVITELHTRLDQGENVVLTRSFQNNGDQIDYQLSHQPLMLAHNADLSTVQVPSSQKEQYTFVRTYRPKPRLILIGAGDDSKLVHSLAQVAGFDVVIGDWREGLCTNERFPGATCVVGFPQSLYEQIQPGEQDYVILMSHNFPREREWIELMIDQDCAYLGIMGSKERTRRLMDQLPAYANLHSPVGLSIGADGPDEIAISIVAELIAVKRGRVLVPRKEVMNEHYRISAYGG